MRKTEYLHIKFELQTVLKLRRNWFENFNFSTSNFRDLKSQLPITCVLSAIYLRNFIFKLTEKFQQVIENVKEVAIYEKERLLTQTKETEMSSKLTSNIINNTLHTTGTINYWLLLEFGPTCSWWYFIRPGCHGNQHWGWGINREI